MVELIEEAFRLQTFLDSHQLQFCFIGGIVVQWWGEPRLTRDVDLTLLTGFGNEAYFIDLILTGWAPRIADARQFALQRRVLLLKSPEGIGIDISLAALPYEELAISRSTVVEMLPGRAIRICSAEDLIVMKLFAGRDTDLRDCRAIAVRQGTERLNWQYIEVHLAELGDLLEEPEIVTRLARMRATLPKR